MKKILFILLFLFIARTSYSAQFNSYTNITTLAGTDEFIVWDGAVKNITYTSIIGLLDALYQPLEATLTDIADGTINENLVNTANPWADNEVADDITASNYLPLAGGTMTGSLVTDNLGIEFVDSDTNPTCSAGEYKIYADLSETTLKKCLNGSVSDMDTSGAGAETNSLETVMTGVADDEVPVGSSADTATYIAIGDCDDSGGNHLNYDTTTNAFSCGTSSSVTDTDTNSLKLYTWSAQSTEPTKPQAAEFDGIAASGNDTGTNLQIKTVDFDDTDDECRGVVFKVPEDVDTSGTAQFHVKWYSQTATSGSVLWYIAWHENAEGESWDSTTTDDDAASDDVQGTVDLTTLTSWTETMSNLGWVADDTVTGWFCRDGDGDKGTDDLTGDASVIEFSIEIPRT